MKPHNDLRNCDHQLHARDGDHSLAGSWAEELTFDAVLGERLRIHCHVCGRFYGYDMTSRSNSSARLAWDEATLPPSPASVEPSIPPSDFRFESEATPLAEGSLPRPIDFQQVRRRITIRQVLELLEWQPIRSEWAAPSGQLRGPCPIRQGGGRRTFSVSLQRNVFRCFAPSCQAQGNQLDLYQQATRLPLGTAARELCDRLGIELPTR